MRPVPQPSVTHEAVRKSALFKFSDIGPGIILAATGIGVGDMVSSTIAGAQYGLTLVWALALGVGLKLAITEGLARWQLGTGNTLIEGWRDHLPRPLLLAFFAYFVVWSYMVSSALVSVSSMVPASVLPVPLPVWGVVHAVGAFLMVYVGRYEALVSVMKWLIILMFASVVTATLLILFWSGTDWSGLQSRAPFSVGYTLSLIGGVGGTVTLLSYGYWIKEAGWSGAGRIASARGDLVVSFGLVFLFALMMIFLSSQIKWAGDILDEGPALCLQLADRIGAETGAIGRLFFLAGFWGVAFSSVLGVWHGVPFLFDDFIHRWRNQTPTGQTGRAYRGWAVYLTLASISALFIQRPVWLAFAYTVVGSFFFPFVIATLLYLNNSRLMPEGVRNRLFVNSVLVGSLALYAYLAVRALA